MLHFSLCVCVCVTSLYDSKWLSEKRSFLPKDYDYKERSYFFLSWRDLTEWLWIRNELTKGKG